VRRLFSIFTKHIKALGGFTIVELLIVIIVIGILATFAIITYSGIQQRAHDVRTQSDINNMQKLVEIYNNEYGSYPKTTNNPQANWHAADVRTDVNCSNGSSQTDWIPGLSNALPQSDPTASTGVNGIKGCYLYVSDGINYVISAWNMVNAPQSSIFYRRLGFRQFQSDSSTQFYTCNDSGVGGVSGGLYDVSQDYYKHSYTVSNITNCNETPPPGA
jgi:prepilin-type N-terminal cleavage/methylation domain-containing protein